MSDIVADFLKEYPPQDHQVVDGELFAVSVTQSLGVSVPRSLVEFWNQAGTGYFSDRELYFFGPGAQTDGPRTLHGWNLLDSWRDVLLSPVDGGPVFVAETCVGDQIGFRHASGGACKAVLFAIDTCELFVISPDFDKLFPHLLAEPHAIVDPDLLAGLRQNLGPLPNHSHYAPVVSPLAGGSFELRNYHIESALVHIKTAVATWKSM